LRKEDFLLHHNKEEFIKILERAAKKKGFLLPLMEKDYYLTLMLSRISELSGDLVFKGGTCLNKIYYAYYRLSEDLDFTMMLPQNETTRGERRQCIQPVKYRIERLAEECGMKIDCASNPGRNESKQYVYDLVYQSALRPIEAKIKLEVSLRFNPIMPVVSKPIRHAFFHPFTGEPLFDGGTVQCLSLDEIVSEKLRAATMRKIIAPRDFYDLDFILRNDFMIGKKEVVELFKKKIEEDGGDPDLKKYCKNFGRTDIEIKDMRLRIEPELFDVLVSSERKNFDLDTALKRINKAMEGAK